MPDSRHAPLSFRPSPRVARDEEFDDSLFDQAATAHRTDADEPPEDGDEPAPAREGLPDTYRMRHDAHYVEQIASRRYADPVQLIPVGEIDGPHPLAAPRDLGPLVESISRLGVLQPLLVREQGGRYLLLAGSRRLAAAIAAGLSEVPCLVHAADDRRARELVEAASITAHDPRRETREASRVPAAVFTEITEHLGAIGACLHLFGERERPLRERVAMGLIQAEVQRGAWLSQALSVLAADPLVASDPVDVGAVTGRVLSALTPEGVLAGVGFDLEDGEDRRKLVRGDEQLLALAVAGMVLAVHALVERVEGARVTLAISHDAARGAVDLAVSQASVALPAAWRAQFFDLSWADRPGGVRVGAGLGAALRIAELHGGTLQLEATAQPGCRLRLSLTAER